jgi:hypothetical protein
MNVQASEWYVPGCAECIEVVANIFNSAVKDASVTRLSFSSGHRHCHAVAQTANQKRVAAGAATAETAPAATQAPNGVLFTEDEVAGLTGRQVMPNGFDHSLA